MKLFVACLVVALCGAANASPMLSVPITQRTANVFKYVADNFDGLTPLQKIETVNEFMDMVLDEMRYFLIGIGMDPMSLPEIHQNFSAGGDGELNLSKGSLKDISTVYRNGDVVILYEERVLRAQVPLNIKHIEFVYDFDIKIMGQNLVGSVKGNVEDIAMEFDMQMNFKKLEMTLNEFEIDELKTLKVKFDGAAGWIINIISGVITGIFKTQIKNVLEGLIGDTARMLIEKINEVLANMKP